MVELALPKNSQMREGKVWPKPAGAKNTREFRVYRWSPDDGQNPSIDTFYTSISTIADRWCSTVCSTSRTRSTRR